MTEIKIAEINILTIVIVLIVGTMGILSLYMNYDQIAVACVSGLLGYTGRYLQTRSETSTTTTNNYGDEE